MPIDSTWVPASEASSKLWEEIEDRVYEYEQDYAAGRAKPLHAYLPADDTGQRQAVLVELVKVDLELRWNDGRPIQLTDYCREYADLGTKDELPPDLVYEAYRVACQHGSAETPEEFCASFPRQRNAVLALAKRSTAVSTAVTRQQPGRTFKAGETFGDFELLALLGKGAFGQVFLARQISLARQVALKITANRGSEARTMAILEHDNIVQVFSESVEEELNLRLLCMQYVPGTTLGRVIEQVAENPISEVEGISFVEAIDAVSTAPAIFQVGVLKERELLATSDHVEAVCLIGTWLAEALAHAHKQGVLHRDIKPDNVLISQFGRPLLADFNLSLDPNELGGTPAGMFGGSPAYMSPEHLDAFNPTNPTPHTAVDERSDIYSLGVVIFELLALRQPFADQPSVRNVVELLQELGVQRRAGAPSVLDANAQAGEPLERVLSRCLRADPKERYQTADELAQDLSAARELQSVRRELPRETTFTTLATQHPLLVLLGVALLPNLLGSAVNIAYNLLRIIPQLTDGQQAVFERLLWGYNLVVYPVCVAWLFMCARPFLRQSARSAESTVELANIRRRVVAFPKWLIIISCLGWLPGGVLFPMVLNWLDGPIAPSIFGHFAADFAISGLIALTYSYFGVETVLLRSMYPRLLIGQSDPRGAARIELRSVGHRILLAQIGAGIIPLAGAVLLIVVGPDADSDTLFRVLVSALIGIGMLGFVISIRMATILQKTVRVLTGV